MQQTPKTATFSEQELGAIIQFLEANIPISLAIYVNGVKKLFAEKLGVTNGKENISVHQDQRSVNSESLAKPTT